MPDTLLIKIQDLTKHFGEKAIFNEASVNITLGLKIGVIGRNGAGKSTLFKMILGDEEIDTGTIQILPQAQLGYLQQHDPFEPSDTVISFLERFTGQPEWECGLFARKFGFVTADFAKPVSAFSGGWQMRLKLASVVLQKPNIILLDEPTNFLDLDTLLVLERFLLDFEGTVLVISHDREFLKHTCDTIMEIDQGKLALYDGDLESYLEYKQEMEAFAKVRNVNIERKQAQLQTFVDRFGSKQSMASAAQNKLKQIARMDQQKIGITTAMSSVHMHIPKIEDKKGTLIELDTLAIGYGEKVVAQTNVIVVERGSKVAVLGENGQGKSTLIKTIASIIPTISGSFAWRNTPKIAYYNQLISHDFKPSETIGEYAKRKMTEGLREQEVYRMLGSFLFSKEDWTKHISLLSGGEQSRLYLACMFLQKADVYLLDEPTNHLDIETVEVMGQAIGKFNGSVFVVSHDRTFVNLIADTIMTVKNGDIRLYNGNYEYYVWNLEQQTRKMLENNIETIVKTESTGGDKETRKKLYELAKRKKTLEKKIQLLQEKQLDQPFDESLKSTLDAAETEFLVLLEQEQTIAV